MTTRRPWLALVLLVVVALPSHAYANAGTPLMWAAMIHLAIGNGIIGLIEGLLIAWLFKTSKNRAITFMVIANYFSAWIGGLFIRGAFVKTLPLDLSNAWRWFWILAALTYALTLILELPFIIGLLRKSEHPIRRSLKASLAVQTISYAVLFGWYWAASGTSLYTRMEVVPPDAIQFPPNVSVYFISRDDGDVYKGHLDSLALTKIGGLGSTDSNDRLFVQSNSVNSDRWDLLARLEGPTRNEPRIVPVLTNVAGYSAVDPRSTRSAEIEGTWFSFGPASRLSTAANSDWEVYAGFWAMEGLRAHNEKTGERIRFSYETPFGQWTARNAVHLPMDKVLFQFGADQICAFDPLAKRVSLLWRGRGPVVIIE